MPVTYAFQHHPAFDPLLARAADAESAIARLDERLRHSPLVDGLTARLAYREACASRHAQGELVHVEDLVLFDAGAYSGPVSYELSAALQYLQLYRSAAAGDPASLLESDRPGEFAADHSRSSLPPHLAGWREALRGSASFPPVLAAAILWDAWLCLEPEPRALWKAPLLTSLALKACGQTRSFLLPIDTGRRYSSYRRDPAQPPEQRAAGCIGWMLSACERTRKELDALALAQELMRHRLRGRRSTSHLARLAELLLNKPVISVAMAARALQVSPQSVRRMLGQLASVPQELSGRSRYRVWGIL